MSGLHVLLAQTLTGIFIGAPVFALIVGGMAIPVPGENPRHHRAASIAVKVLLAAWMVSVVLVVLFHDVIWIEG